MNIPKNQHYVPQFLLRNFSFDNNHLFCFDKQNGKVFSPNIRNVASENFYNDLEDGKAEFSFESQLTELEDKAALSIQKLIRQQTIRCLGPNDIQTISLFIAVQIVRTKSAREELSHVNRELSKLIRESGAEPNSVENFHEFKSEREVKEAALYNLRIASDLFPYLANKRWALYTSGSKFITSDNPICRQNTVNKDKRRGTLGLSNKGIEVYFPLTPSIILGLLCEETFQEILKRYELMKDELDAKGKFETRNYVNSVRRKIPIECSPENIENLNSLQVMYSERFLFSHTNDFGLAREMIAENSEIRHGIRMIIK